MKKEQQSHGVWSFFWPFYRPFPIGVFFLVFFSSLVGLHTLLNSYLIKRMIDSLTEIEEQALMLRAIVYPALLIVVNLEINNLLWRAINYINLKITPIVKNRVIDHMFSYVHSQSHQFFHNTLSGALSNNITILSESIERIQSSIGVRIIRGGMQLIVSLIVLYFVHPIFSWALLAWTTFFISVSLIFSKKIRGFSDAYAKSQSQVSGKIVDSVVNFSNVKIFSRKYLEVSLLQSALNGMKQKFQSKEWFLIRFYLVQGFSITCLIGFLVYTLVRLRLSQQVTVGDFAFILSVAFYVTENVWSITEQIDQLNEIVGKCKQSLVALFKPVEIQDEVRAQSLIIKEGKIVFEKVQFQYKETEPLFQDKSIEISAGQKVGLVGFSGSGKSTFVNLLLRFYEVLAGRILIDGQDIREVTQHSLHSAIGLIPQEPTLFHRSIMENIRYGRPESTDEQVENAAKRAHIHEFVSSLNQGYASLLGERGVKVSGGQRQRIAMARVILKNAPILILDEATSQLDSVTESGIREALKELMIGKTTLVIAHRFSTLLDMDRILVFEKGRIVEDGNHQDLLRKEGLYKTLVDAQVGAFLPKLDPMSTASN